MGLIDQIGGKTGAIHGGQAVAAGRVGNNFNALAHQPFDGLAHSHIAAIVVGQVKLSIGSHLVDNLGAARGRLPDAAMRRRMESFIDGL